jgi:ribonuclease D
MTPNIIFHYKDIPQNLELGSLIAIDTETMGLNLHRDQLCVVQISAGDGTCHIIQMDRKTYDCPNLKTLFSDPTVTKLFHFARFDIAAIFHYLGVLCKPIYCTKIAAKLTRTYTDRHGLKDLCRDLLGIEISKQMQTSDWGAVKLTEEQLKYAAIDVLHLHRLKDILDQLLEREQRLELAKECFEFLPYRAQLDLLNFDQPDIFAH